MKKLLTSNGFHVYNLKEESKWSNGNDNSKLVFQIRNINDQDENLINSFQQKLKEKGLSLQKSQDQIIIPERKPDIFPVQAKWNDANIRQYYSTVENNKKPEKKNFNVKTGFPVDKTLLTYKNDKIYSNKLRSEKDKEIETKVVNTKKYKLPREIKVSPKNNVN